MEYEAGAKSLSRRKIRVEPGQLRLFAKAIGETNQIYFDQAAAESAGLRAPLAPPTFAYSLGVLAFGSESWSEDLRSEEHTSELQSLMRNTYAVFSLKKNKSKIHPTYQFFYVKTKQQCSYITT